VEEFTDVDELLKVDASCAEQSKLVFAEIGSNAMESANSGLRVFAATAAWLRNFEDNHPAAAGFNDTADELEISGEELWEIVKSPVTESHFAGPRRVRPAKGDADYRSSF
jgi:hypothetical protein